MDNKTGGHGENEERVLVEVKEGINSGEIGGGFEAGP